MLLLIALWLAVFGGPLADPNTRVRVCTPVGVLYLEAQRCCRPLGLA